MFDKVEKKVLNHPLVKEESGHYTDDSEMTAAESFERKYTGADLLAWAKITVDKYIYRMDKKGQYESDLVKKIDYQTYIQFLLFFRDRTTERDWRTKMFYEIHSASKFKVVYEPSK